MDKNRLSKNRLGMRWMVVAGFVGVTLGGVTEASACGGEWIPAMEEMDQVDYRPAGVARAEKALEQGKYASAAGAIVRMMPHIKSLKAKDSASIVARAQHVLAVATARSGGRLDIEREVPQFIQGTWLGKTDSERRTNLQFAASSLKQISDLKDGDPAVQTELAEALAQLDDRRDEAKEILETLAQKDLITSPEGYRTLAELRQRGGDQKGHMAALQRCQTMSENPNVCSNQRVDVSFKS